MLIGERSQSRIEVDDKPNSCANFFAIFLSAVLQGGLLRRQFRFRDCEIGCEKWGQTLSLFQRSPSIVGFWTVDYRSLSKDNLMCW